MGSASKYLDIKATSTADISTTISDYTVSNIRSEGISPRLISLNMLSNIDNFLIDNAWMEELAPPSIQIGTSRIRGFTDKNNGNQKVRLGAHSPGGHGLVIKGYKVGDKTISYVNNNRDVNSLVACLSAVTTITNGILCEVVLI